MRDTMKRSLFTAACVVAVAGALALIVYFSHILILQSRWNHALSDLEDSFRAARGRECTIEYRGESVPADKDVLDYYLGILTMPRSMATHYAKGSDGDRGIRLSLPDVTVSFAPYRDEVSTEVRWSRDGSDYGFVLGGTMDYPHLMRYFQNTVRHAAANGD